MIIFFFLYLSKTQPFTGVSTAEKIYEEKEKNNFTSIIILKISNQIQNQKKKKIENLILELIFFFFLNIILITKYADFINIMIIFFFVC